MESHCFYFSLLLLLLLLFFKPHGSRTRLGQSCRSPPISACISCCLPATFLLQAFKACLSFRGPGYPFLGTEASATMAWLLRLCYPLALQQPLRDPPGNTHVPELSGSCCLTSLLTPDLPSVASASCFKHCSRMHQPVHTLLPGTPAALAPGPLTGYTAGLSSGSRHAVQYAGPEMSRRDLSQGKDKS